MVNKKVNFGKLGLIFSIEQRIYESINELLHAKNLLDFGEITKESYELKKKKLISLYTKKLERKKQNNFLSFIIAMILLFLLFIIGFLGSYHIVKGSNIDGLELILRTSFGFSEMNIDLDTLTAISSASAQSKYPLSIKDCQNSGHLKKHELFQRYIQKDSRMVRMKGLEPSRREAPDPKSGMYSNLK